MGIRLMEPKAKGQQPGSRNYTQEFRESVATEANDPNRSIAEVARSYGLNANMVAQWRRRSLEARQARADEPMSCAELLSVSVKARDHAHACQPAFRRLGLQLHIEPTAKAELKLTRHG
ncbi:transposase [Burkholderia alba]|uniref:transposase n=1 Tax=Burkholderia alba TaxID=2683677 RepID=UPI0038995726